MFVVIISGAGLVGSLAQLVGFALLAESVQILMPSYSFTFSSKFVTRSNPAKISSGRTDYVPYVKLNGVSPMLDLEVVSSMLDLEAMR